MVGELLGSWVRDGESWWWVLLVEDRSWEEGGDGPVYRRGRIAKVVGRWDGEPRGSWLRDRGIEDLGLWVWDGREVR